MKICSKCKTNKPATSEFFYRLRKGFRPDCKVCTRAVNLAYFNQNKDIVRRKNRERYVAFCAQLSEAQKREYIQNKHLWSRYNITLREKNNLIEFQGRVCGMKDCTNLVDLSSPVDHNHLTGEVRGVLCFSCNTQLASYENGRIRQEAFNTYLVNPPNHDRHENKCG